MCRSTSRYALYLLGLERLFGFDKRGREADRRQSYAECRCAGELMMLSTEAHYLPHADLTRAVRGQVAGQSDRAHGRRHRYMGLIDELISPFYESPWSKA